MATKKKENELVVANLPSYIKTDGPARGSEDVGMEDLTIPRLELVQSLSPCRDKDDPTYIENAEEGMLYNNVSRELYGESVLVIPVMFKKEFLIWKDRKQGGGFRGSFPTMDDANEQIMNLVNSGEDPSGSLEAADTAQHLCLLLKKSGKVEEIAISMSRSKMKVSRQWNALIRMMGGDRFSRVYEITGVADTNDKGEKFKNLMIKPKGYPLEKVYKAAEELYFLMESGDREMNVNTDTDASDSTTTKGANF